MDDIELPPLEGAESDEDEFSASVRAKARRLVSQGRVRRDSEREGVWWVGSSTSDTKDEYRVELSERFQSCSCKFGLNQGGGNSRCSHVLAASMAANYKL